MDENTPTTRHRRSNEIGDLMTALATAQGELNNVEKTQEGYGYKYADIGQVLTLVRPVLSRHGVAVMQMPAPGSEGCVALETLLAKGEQWISVESEIPVEGKKGLSAPQCIGSSITYLRRYALTAVLGIAQEDDDAAPASGNNKAITADQAAEINRLINETGADTAKMLKWVGADAVENIKAADYNRVTAALNKKLKEAA